TSFLGALNMLGLAKRVNAKILQASTSEIYGDPEVSPQPESYAGHVNCVGVRACYDEGKRVAETLFFDYYRMHQIDIRVARIFNTYGPGMHPHDGRVVSNFIMQALANEPITIYGDGAQTRSFCFVDDLVTGLIQLMESDQKGPMNLGNPHEITISTLANTIIRLTNSTSTIVTMDAPNDDPKRRKPDITLASEYLGWQPTVELETGLQQTIDYFRSIDMNYFRKPTPHTAHKSSENDL
ncbi:UDP-glucuronic acid decarboxylase 1, partial [Thraustotheca clavata]